MTCKKSIKYMQDKDYLKHWLLPLEGLQHGTIYNESIPGDSPELMPLYETLNMDTISCFSAKVRSLNSLGTPIWMVPCPFSQ
jgi:hypothetical protein